MDESNPQYQSGQQSRKCVICSIAIGHSFSDLLAPSQSVRDGTDQDTQGRDGTDQDTQGRDGTGHITSAYNNGLLTWPTPLPSL